MSTPVGVGDLVAWDGGVLLIGRANRIIPTHAHQAIQVAFGYSGPIRLRRSDDDPWMTLPLGVVASRHSHSMDATSATCNAVIFVEPETSAGRALAAHLRARGLIAIDDAAVRSACVDLFAGWLAGSSKPQLITGAARVISALTSSAAAPTVADDRILRAIEFIRTHLDTNVTLNAVAAHVFLSPGRFRHLFVEQTGMGMRPYILWRRFILAWDLLAQGESISTAAHRAGFADAAHFTRTSNRMFGFPPSLLQVAAGPTRPTP